MTAVEHYDILILGGGKAGKTLAMDQARAGKRVAVIEVGMIGGSCINVACIPTKTLVRSAGMAALARRLDQFGIETGSAAVNMRRVAARTAEVVAGMVAANAKAFAESGFELVIGWGRFVAPRIIEVTGESGTRQLSGDRIYLNLGTRAAIPSVPGLHEAAPLTHVEALKLDVLPSHLVVVGGGYIGMEMAQTFRHLGSTVTVIEHGPQLAAREDTDVAAAIQSVFEADGIALVLDANIAQVTGRSGESITIALDDGRRVTGSHLLVAVGREPMTRDIGLELAGVTVDVRGFIQVDARLATSAPGVWALGEAAGSPMSRTCHWTTIAS